MDAPLNGNERRFPTLPAFSVRWTPVYLEPVMASGEHITVAVAAVPATGEPAVMPVLDRERAECLFGSGAGAFLSVVDLCVQDLRLYLVGGGAIEEWQAPVQGAAIGSPRPLRAADMTAALRLAVQKSAFLGCLASFTGVEEEDEICVEAAPDRWVQQIEGALRDRRPDLIARMRGRFRVVDKARETRVDFLGAHYAANFARIVPGRSFGRYIKDAKVKLWDLDALHTASMSLMFPDQRVAYELLLWRPRDSDPAYSEKDIRHLQEAALEIEYEGDKKGLRVVPFIGEEQATEAASRIISMEAA